MDTKLKSNKKGKFLRKRWLQFGAFVLSVALLSNVWFILMNTIISSNGNINPFFERDYLNSSKFALTVDNKLFTLSNVLNDMDLAISSSKEGTDLSSLDLNESDVNVPKKNIQKTLDELTCSYYYKIDGVEISNTTLSEIKSNKYFIGINSSLNSPIFSEQLNSIELHSLNTSNYLTRILYYYIDQINLEDDSFENVEIYIAFDDKAIEENILTFSQDKTFLTKNLYLIILSLLFAIALIIYQTIVSGRLPDDDDVHIWKIDKLYAEIHLISLLSVFALFIENLQNYTISIIQSNDAIRTILFATAVFAITIAGIIYLSLCRRIKAYKLRHSFFFTGILFDTCLKIFKTLLPKFFYYTKICLNKIGKNFRFFSDKLYKRFPVTQKIHRLTYLYVISILVVLAFATLFASLILLLVGIIFATYIYIQESSKNFEEINKGFDKGYKESLKAEKMKIDLITNVSHDLKTPLTSIISYAELLIDEEMSQAAKDYVLIINDKSKRLNTMVTDLFDLSKSTSGNLTFNLETLDLGKLVYQTIGDMNDKIQKSQLKLVVNIPEEPVTISADGAKLYRVIQNLIENSLKYTMPGTRIHLDLIKEADLVTLTIKNIANYEMNFTKEEILERFARGDSARSSEGTGLGLSIAESFTNNCGGTLKIELDGDMFKVILNFYPN